MEIGLSTKSYMCNKKPFDLLKDNLLIERGILFSKNFLKKENDKWMVVLILDRILSIIYKQLTYVFIIKSLYMYV